jgi:AraC-like DNA-binding protein/mannose-6-phosphate isomerase-like protein (cupin superfamily)
LFIMSEAEAFPPGQTAIAAETGRMRRPTQAHAHDFAELVFIRSGQGTQHTEKGITSLSEGSLVILAPGSWHAVVPEDELTISNVYLSSSLLAGELAWMAAVPRIGPLLHRPSTADPSVVTIELDAGTGGAIGDSLARLAGASGKNLLYRLARLFDLFADLALALETRELARVIDTHPVPFQETGTALHPGTRYRDSVARAIDLLHDRIDQAWSLDALAREVWLSPSQLARVFRTDTGASPMAYLQQIRAERLAHLLRTTDLTVAAAARAVGWNDASYAARRFRTHWKATPNEYRNRIQ